MDIEFVDPAEAPVPPDQMSFRSIEVEPYSDGERVSVTLSVAPFLVRPSIDIEVLDAEGSKVASSSIIDATETKLSLTLHLRSPAAGDPLTLVARLLYPDIGQVDLQQTTFSRTRTAPDRSG
jgi:hypothetical protein